MKKLFIILISFYFVLSFAAQVSAELKVGIVDLYRVLNESEEGKRAVSELQSMLEARQKSLDEKQRKIQSLREEYEKKKTVLNEEARKSKEEEIERLGRDLQRSVADYQMELQKKQNEITQSMLKEIKEIINDFAKKERYNLILEKAEQIVIYSTPEVEITDKIITLFNQKTSTKKGKK
jgi:outer membrane protein